jgi:hypothetical protein
MVAAALYAGMMMETFTSDHAGSGLFRAKRWPAENLLFESVSYIQAHWQQFLYQINKSDRAALAGCYGCTPPGGLSAM